MTIERRRASEMLRLLREYLSELESARTISRAEFQKDRLKQAGVKYLFVVAIECCIDLANHLISQHEWRRPESYVDAFRVLADHDVLSKEFLPTLAQIARFRNRLVHLYWEVDVDTVYNILQSNLSDLRTYEASITGHLSNHEGGDQD